MIIVKKITVFKKAYRPVPRASARRSKTRWFGRANTKNKVLHARHVDVTTACPGNWDAVFSRPSAARGPFYTRRSAYVTQFIVCR